MLAQAIGEIVAIFAVDPPQIGLAGDVDDPDAVLLLQPVAGREGNAEALLVEQQDIEPLVERLGLGHHGNVELSFQQHVGKALRHAFDQGQLAARICHVKSGEKSHEPRRPNRAHDPQPDLRLLQVEKLLRRRLGRLGIGGKLAQVRLDQQAEIGQMRQLALAP